MRGERGKEAEAKAGSGHPSAPPGPGDEATWMKINVACEGYGPLRADLFERDFGSDREVQRKRICFIDDAEGLGVATPAAWFGDRNGETWGRVHWVAVDRKAQGRGLAKPLIAAVCRRLAELRHERAYLTTNSVRLRAIALYGAFGFVPEAASEAERQAWDAVRERLKGMGKQLRGGSWKPESGVEGRSPGR